MLTSGERDKIERAARALGIDMGNRRPTEEDAWWLARDLTNYALKMAREARTPRQKAEYANAYSRCRSLLKISAN
jgi:hypothetical protein